MGVSKTMNFSELYRRIKRALAPLMDPPNKKLGRDGDLGFPGRIELKDEMQSGLTSSRLGTSAQTTCAAGGGGLESSLSPSALPNPNVSSWRPTANLWRPTFRGDLIRAGAGHKSFMPNDEQSLIQNILLHLSQPRSEDNPPDGTLAVPLLRHQRIALSWMVKKETTDPSCSGGILADDQGLGKTISTIALILKERSPSPTVSKPSVRAKGRAAGGTLIVCPTSVLRQWSEELRHKVDNKANLSVLVYHGCNRTKDPFELANYDVVLTTYSVVSMEVPKRPLGDDEGKDGHPLGRVSWFRVVLDEAQNIKNYKTRVAKACCGLRAERRWCLSGTPIQNAIDDLYSYFRFLRFEPYSSYKNFHSSLKVPIQIWPKHGYMLLQAVLRTVMLRRTKGSFIDGEPVITLPPKRVELKKVKFTRQEREFYRRIEDRHMHLLELTSTEHLYNSSKIKAALEVLQSLSKSRDANSPKCKDEHGSCNHATKIAGEKALVFSQWTRMLDLLEDRLKRLSIQYRRLDGTMSIVARDRAVKDFNTIPEVSVLIMSLKAASLGLNLVVACHVILLDPWWNPATEDQAIDRAHRIGQRRPVTVLRLTVEDTVEDRILAIQKKKRELVASAFGEDNDGSQQTRLTEEDLKYLFRYKA
ncbi:unnamed protein product [Cuscuta campestris]|uniref:Helicase C-terminal domain-containing protein n=1 Tax=Cuscuta campestris TaxID=132261 RepID=A0A484MJ69_9ASTE|nr:unnamed protein product [Cuscuta campestris]